MTVFRIDVLHPEGRYSVISSSIGYRRVDACGIEVVEERVWLDHVRQLPTEVELADVGENSDWGTGALLDLRPWSKPIG